MMIRLFKIVAIVSVCFSTRTDSYCMDILKEIWKIRHSIMTCTYELNYGCRCDATTDVTCNFKCISMAKMCDGYPDCPFGDDETDCPEKLPVPSDCPGEMQCPSGECATVCDHTIECNNEATDCEPLDEQDCRHNCTESDVVCSIEGGCGAFCSEDVQCNNGYDESMCYIECKDDEVSCELGDSPMGGCAELCDDDNECEGPGWDEDDIYCGECCLACGFVGDTTCTKTDSCS